MTQPTLYIPHGGGPCFFMDWRMGPPDTWHAMAAWLRRLPGTLPEPPRALLVISAHWEAPDPTVTVAKNPALIYDYAGFPQHTYALEWPAPGAPELGEEVRSLLRAAGFNAQRQTQRGFDHGVFVPLKVAFPDARVPTIQLSLIHGLDPETHLRMGRVLAPLRDQGVLIVGSGMSFHNMQAFLRPSALAPSRAFHQWFEDAVTSPPPARDAALRQWRAAPHARYCHPREEHLLPLMVAVGAAGDDPGAVVFRDEVLGVQVAAARFGALEGSRPRLG